MYQFIFFNREKSSIIEYFHHPFLSWCLIAVRKEKRQRQKTSNSKMTPWKATKRKKEKTFSDVNWENEETSSERVKKNYCHLIFSSFHHSSFLYMKFKYGPDEELNLNDKGHMMYTIYLFIYLFLFERINWMFLIGFKPLFVLRYISS